MSKVDVKKLPKGKTVCVETSSGNEYLFTVIDPKECKANVTRVHAQPQAPKAGNLGERVISRFICIGKPAYHGYSGTSKVTKITLK